MGVTIDITGVPAERFVFSPSPLAELTAMVHALSEPAHHPDLHGWVTATTSALKPDLHDRLIEADFLWRSARADFFVPGRPRATLAEELDDVDRLDDEAYASAALMTTSCGSVPAHHANPLAIPAGRRRALDLAAARGPRQA
ncbi:DUF5937 family protein, partial [Luedemannella flava]|uniref:DUF5937 family protein n=1 Tax=Luedemannella flava TaxID=349316 RepID=UPI0031D9B01A